MIVQTGHPCQKALVSNAEIAQVVSLDTAFTPMEKNEKKS